MYARDRTAPEIELGSPGWLIGNNQWRTSVTKWIAPQFVEEDDPTHGTIMTTSEALVRSVDDPSSAMPATHMMGLALASHSPLALLSTRPVAENRRRRDSGDTRYGSNLSGVQVNTPLLESLAMQFVSAYDSALQSRALASRSSQQMDDLTVIPRSYDRPKNDHKDESDATASAARSWLANRALITAKYLDAVERNDAPISLVDIGALLIAGPEGLAAKRVVTMLGARAATKIDIGDVFSDIDLSNVT